MAAVDSNPSITGIWQSISTASNSLRAHQIERRLAIVGHRHLHAEAAATSRAATS